MYLDTSQNINRTFTIKDSSGNIIYQDCQIEETTVFETEGDEMNSQVINNTNTEVNNLNDNLTASDNLKFRFATDGEGNHGYLGADDSFIPFKSGDGAKLVGTYSSNTTVDVSSYGATSANEFLLVPSQNTSGSYLGYVGDVSSPHSWSYYVNSNMQLTNNSLSLTLPRVNTNVRGGYTGMWAGDISFYVPCSLYYVGKIESV